MLARALKLNIISVIIARVEGEKRAALPYFSSLLHKLVFFFSSSRIESDEEENGTHEGKEY